MVENELKQVLDHLFNQYKSYIDLERCILFKKEWDSILSGLLTNDYIISASSYQEEDQLFKKTIVFPNAKFTISFNIRSALSLCKKHNLTLEIPIDRKSVV